MSQKFEQFGKYLLLEKLAMGGMAEVFVARSLAIGGISKFVAIKRILPQYADAQEFIDMFKDEAKIAINLNHSNIVSIHDFGVQNQQFYLVMDYVEGRNLRQILNKIKKSNVQLSVEQIIYIIKEVSSGLDHAHRCLDGTTGKPLNITHRDMSPQNVMISFEGEIKIVDFGIAKAESQLETTRAGTLKGKFGYMSPEQAEGQTVDLRTDIFSLGIVLWELLANDRLFIASNEVNTLKKIRDCQVPSLRKINPNIPPELERITMKALARDRNLRYQTAAAMHRDLNRFLNRQYPDFSTQDFATYIKGQFTEELYSTRQRLIEYAKIPAVAPEPQAIGQTPLPNQEVKTGTDPSSLSLTSKPEAVTEGSSSEPRRSTISGVNINFHPQANSDSPPQKVEGESTAAKIKFNSASPTATTPSPSTAANNGISLSEVGPTTSVRSQALRYSQSSPSINYSQDSKRVGAGTMLLISLMLAVGGYVFLAKYYSSAMAPVIAILNPYFRPFHAAFGIQSQTAPKDVSTQSQDTASVSPQAPAANTTEASPSEQALAEPTAVSPDAKEPLLVTSAPSGAEIFIDDVPTGAITPSRIDVPAGTAFTLSLRRNGYIDYRREDMRKTQIGSRFSATLQQALVGYLDIDVTPPQNAKVFINGRQLKGETLPINNYAVPAETPVTIRAVDPITQSSAQQVIKIPKDRRMQILLDLRPGAAKNNRQPTYNR